MNDMPFATSTTTATSLSRCQKRWVEHFVPNGGTDVKQVIRDREGALACLQGTNTPEVSREELLRFANFAMMSANPDVYSPVTQALPWSAVNQQDTNVYSPRAQPNSRFSDDTLPVAAEGSTDTIYSRWTVGSPRLGGPAVANASIDEECSRSKDLLQPRLISPMSVVDTPFERNLKREPSGFPFGPNAAAEAAAMTDESRLAPPPASVSTQQLKPPALTTASSWFDLSDSRDSKHARGNLNIRRAREASLADAETDKYHATLAVSNVAAKNASRKRPVAPPATPLTLEPYRYELKQSYDMPPPRATPRPYQYEPRQSHNMPETPVTPARAPVALPSSPSQTADSPRCTRRSMSTSPLTTSGPRVRPPLIHSMSHGSSETRVTGNGTPASSYPTPPATAHGHTSFLPLSRNGLGLTFESDSDEDEDADDVSESHSAPRGRTTGPRPPLIFTTSYPHSVFPHQTPPLERGVPTTDTCGSPSLESSMTNTTTNASLEDFLLFGSNEDGGYRRRFATPSQSSESSMMSPKSSTSSIRSAFASATLGVKPKFAKLASTLTKKSGTATAASLPADEPAAV